MWTVLLSKEVRECALYAGLALLAQLHILGGGMDLPVLATLSAGRGAEIPFVSGVNHTEREYNFTTVIILTAIVIGLHQTIWESWRQTTLFLLHRPLPRSQIFLVKLMAGSLLLFGVSAVPLLIYSIWAATPGSHASPFYWGSTESWWRSVFIAWCCYLGAFLTGLRPAWWLGSRTWPLIAALVISMGLKFLPHAAPPPPLFMVGLIYIGYLLLGAGLIVTILDTAERREFP